MDRTNLDELRRELATLEATEARISAERSRLHHQIDYGFANEATRARERRVSDERRRLHERIDSLRELLGPAAASDEAPPLAEPSLSLREWSGISPELVATDDASLEEERL